MSQKAAKMTIVIIGSTSQHIQEYNFFNVFLEQILGTLLFDFTLEIPQKSILVSSFKLVVRKWAHPFYYYSWRGLLLTILSAALFFSMKI